MTDTITLTGLVATEPRHLATVEGLPITSFRLASTQRRFDRARQAWVDGDTNWYTITAFRRLAANASLSLVKGQRVIVTGRLRLRDWEKGDRKGIAIEVEADAIGHDLTWGTAHFQRNTVAVSLDPQSGSAEAGARSAEAGAEAGHDADVGTEAGASADRGDSTMVGGVDSDGWAVPGASLREQAVRQAGAPGPGGAAEGAAVAAVAAGVGGVLARPGGQDELAETPF